MNVSVRSTAPKDCISLKNPVISSLSLNISSRKKSKLPKRSWILLTCSLFRKNSVSSSLYFPSGFAISNTYARNENPSFSASKQTEKPFTTPASDSFFTCSKAICRLIPHLLPSSEYKSLPFSSSVWRIHLSLFFSFIFVKCKKINIEKHINSYLLIPFGLLLAMKAKEEQ